MSRLARLARLASRISVRMLAFNVLLVFLPAAGVLYLDVYEKQLLRAQERSMVQQGRVLAAALSEREAFGASDAEDILIEMAQRITARIRVLDSEGRLLADSSLLGPRREPGDEQGDAAPGARSHWLYRLGAGLFNLPNRLLRGSASKAIGREFYTPDAPFRGVEVEAAMAGRYGAATRVSPGQRSVTLYSAIPVRGAEGALGVVLVSQSTLRLLQDLYEVRLAVFQVFLASLAVAAVLSLLVSTTIARPLRRLQREASAVLDRRGRLIGRFRGSNRRDEIGDLARALEDLSRRLEQRIGFIESFAADLTHTFKNPLASIRSATQLLSECEDPVQRERFLHMVERAVARLEGLLSTAREISLIDSQLGEEQRVEIPLAALLSELVEGFRLRATPRLIYQLAVPDQEIYVSASPERLAQVFENVLDNARSFSPEGGTVWVRLERQAGKAVVTIRDEGPGVPEEHLQGIFARFFSLRGSEAQTPDGAATGSSEMEHAGLGLAIARAVVEGYGGAISVRNANPGGAVFEVRLDALR
jgi:two-component system sensor histidine kinase ChvG